VGEVVEQEIKNSGAQIENPAKTGTAHIRFNFNKSNFSLALFQSHTPSRYKLREK